MTEVVRDRVALAAAREAMIGSAAVVMTMGALHDGHRALLRAARARAAYVVVTIFVNPLQFAPGEDLDRYPRTFDADLALCAAEGVDLVYAPTVADMYPGGAVVRVDPGPRGEVLEGASRPGFFHGVLAVVLALLERVRPDVAVFGEKDWQQLALVRRMVRERGLAVDVVGVATVREPDGLALSSRNTYLSADERLAARALSAALRAGAAAVDPVGAARAVLDAAPGVELDYLALTAPDLGPPPAVGEARLLVAARIGTTRLIDSVGVRLTGAGWPVGRR